MDFIDWLVAESYNDNGPHKEVILLPKELRVDNLYCMPDAILSHRENVQWRTTYITRSNYFENS